MNDLRIGIVTGDADGWHTRQLVAAARRVAQAAVVDPLDLALHVDDHGAKVWFGSEPAEAFDALILRGLNDDGLADLQLEGFSLLEAQVPVVVNRVRSVLTALDKARTSFLLRQAGLPTPLTLVTQRQAEAEAAVERFGEAVLKPLYGSLGEDLVRVVPGEAAREQIRRMLDAFGAVYVQRFEPPGGRDIRAFVVGGRVVAAIYRVARQGQWITSVYRGAATEPVQLPAAVQDLCVQAAAVVGLDYTGVDVIETAAGPSVLEVNGTPSWMGVDAAWQRSMAEEIIGHVVRRVAAERETRQRYEAHGAVA